MFVTHDCVQMNVAYKNLSDMDSKPLTGFIKQGIFALDMTEITFIVSFHNITLYGKFYFNF